MSTLQHITASIVQGSAIGLASYVVNLADLTILTPGNVLCKHADDTYVIVPAVNVHKRDNELTHIEA